MTESSPPCAPAKAGVDCRNTPGSCRHSGPRLSPGCASPSATNGRWRISKSSLSRSDGEVAAASAADGGADAVRRRATFRPLHHSLRERTPSPWPAATGRISSPLPSATGRYRPSPSRTKKGPETGPFLVFVFRRISAGRPEHRAAASGRCRAGAGGRSSARGPRSFRSTARPSRRCGRARRAR